MYTRGSSCLALVLLNQSTEIGGKDNKEGVKGKKKERERGGGSTYHGFEPHIQKSHSIFTKPPLYRSSIKQIEILS